MQQKFTPDQMTTLSTCLAKAKEDGYSEDFRINAGGLSSTGNNSYSPEEVTVENFYRFEGQSDPDDNSILYILRTSDGLKGTLSDAFGTYADPKITAFMQEVEDITKKIKTE